MHSTLAVAFEQAVGVQDLAKFLEGHSSLLARAKGVIRHTDSRCFERQLAAGRVDVALHGTSAQTTCDGRLVLIAAGSDSESQVHMAADDLAAEFGARRMIHLRD